MNQLTIEQIREAARSLAEHLLSDIPLCTTREEHIRVTARANAAAALYNGLISERGPLIADDEAEDQLEQDKNGEVSES